MCGTSWGNIRYKDANVCDKCFIEIRLRENFINNKDLENNSFIVEKNGKEYIGLIMGYQHRVGNVDEDKFYIYLNQIDGDFSIFYNGWMTEKELIKVCNRYKIDIHKLLK